MITNVIESLIGGEMEIAPQYWFLAGIFQENRGRSKNNMRAKPRMLEYDWTMAQFNIIGGKARVTGDIARELFLIFSLLVGFPSFLFFQFPLFDIGMGGFAIAWNIWEMEYCR